MYAHVDDRLSEDIFPVADTLQYVSFYLRIASSFLMKKGGRCQLLNVLTVYWIRSSEKLITVHLLLSWIYLHMDRSLEDCGLKNLYLDSFCCIILSLEKLIPR